MGKINKQQGFTIVELLIVIVVIGILAAITIIAYNGTRSRANIALVTSELVSSATVMGADRAINDKYASVHTSVDNGKGLPISSGTVFQYHSTATTYCITATNGNATYMISDTSPTPTAGICAGDPINGNIANLVTNPGFEANMTGWAGTYGTTPISRVTSGSGIVTGGATLEVNLQTWNQSGAQYNYSNLQASTTYTASAYVTLISGDSTLVQIRAGDGSGTEAWKNISASLIPDVPVRVSLTWKSSVTSPNGGIQFWRSNTTASTGVIRIDNFMITQGSALYNYADGASAGWMWNGVANNTASTGAPL